MVVAVADGRAKGGSREGFRRPQGQKGIAGGRAPPRPPVETSNLDHRLKNDKGNYNPS